jgi:hypothetical protein
LEKCFGNFGEKGPKPIEVPENPLKPRRIKKYRPYFDDEDG